MLYSLYKNDLSKLWLDRTVTVETFKSQNECKTTRKIAQRGTDVQVSTALERLQLFPLGRAGFYIGNARRVCKGIIQSKLLCSAHALLYIAKSLFFLWSHKTTLFPLCCLLLQRFFSPLFYIYKHHCYFVV